MAFLDNSGDIILDAVLTDLGRQRMADGRFRITKFAVGDDEIDYGLYNKNNPSGSAYYDLEILQTPIMEAFTQTNAGINYGLLTNTATDLLYLPVLDVNTKGLDSTIIPAPTLPNIYLVASSDSNTTTKLTDDGLGNDYHTVSNVTSGPAILLEAGLNTSLPKGTLANRSRYLVANNLVDNHFYVYYDNRFINSILGPAPTAVFENTTSGTGVSNINVALKLAASISTDLQLENHSAARIAGAPNGVYFQPGDATPDVTTSVIAGPRSSFTMINIEINPNLDAEFSLYGTVAGALVAGSSRTYNYLDTILYVQGARTGIQIQVPIRIVKYVAG